MNERKAATVAVVGKVFLRPASTAIIAALLASAVPTANGWSWSGFSTYLSLAGALALAWTIADHWVPWLVSHSQRVLIYIFLTYLGFLWVSLGSVLGAAAHMAVVQFCFVLAGCGIGAVMTGGTLGFVRDPTREPSPILGMIVESLMIATPIAFIYFLGDLMKIAESGEGAAFAYSFRRTLRLFLIAVSLSASHHAFSRPTRDVVFAIQALGARIPILGRLENRFFAGEGSLRNLLVERLTVARVLIFGGLLAAVVFVIAQASMLLMPRHIMDYWAGQQAGKTWVTSPQEIRFARRDAVDMLRYELCTSGPGFPVTESVQVDALGNGTMSKSFNSGGLSYDQETGVSLSFRMSDDDLDRLFAEARNLDLESYEGQYRIEIKEEAPMCRIGYISYQQVLIWRLNGKEGRIALTTGDYRGQEILPIDQIGRSLYAHLERAKNLGNMKLRVPSIYE